VIFFCQLISGLRENSGILLLLLADTVDRFHNGNISHQSVLHGLPQRLFSHPLVWPRLAAEADQISPATVSCCSLQ